MRKIIHHLRKQPEEVRRSILHIIMIVFVVILVILWIYSLRVNLDQENLKLELKESTQPFKDLSEDLGGDINSL